MQILVKHGLRVINKDTSTVYDVYPLVAVFFFAIAHPLTNKSQFSDYFMLSRIEHCLVGSTTLAQGMRKLYL